MLVRALAAATALHAAIAHGNDLPLNTIAEVALPGDTSRFDYADFDAGRHLLFIAHLGASEVLAFDTQQRKVVARIANLGRVHGVLAIPALKRVYASATGTDEIVAIDADTLHEIARMPGGTYPDGMAYAPDAHKLYVSDETGATETVIDANTNTRVATIPLGGEVGNSRYDAASKRIFVNGQTSGELVEIDPATDTIAARHTLAGARGNHGLLIDTKRRLAFIACEDNDKLLVFDLRTCRVKGHFDVGRKPDVLAEDEDAGIVYVASESGVVDMFRVQAGTTRKIASGMLAPNAHVVAVDAATHLVYFPLRDRGGHPALLIARPSAAAQ